ncbi:diguanylate cyclase (GGDEF) domain-containing protein [Clostridium amylolyticum]|uniref:Diguanylate cyclase (GGDEF) domain-containing protein n=1 Tax=Clostridium amylolyticum TaxID=1121298 RepID=A0A1M6GXD5_9CLOT|nr:diguanylate cyclase [Clostridium amylolyticum]SHJ14606.1 diguanylate cyclase (GGDEF) domain-containing protein [Clostridium amylolyticum]
MDKKRNVLIILLLTFLNFITNFLPLSFLISVDFIFGNVFSMLVAVIYGPWIGLISSLIGNYSTILIWDHGYAMINMAIQTLVVGFVFKNHYRYSTEAVLGYWIIFGAPYIFVIYYFFLNNSANAAIMIVLKQSINELINIMVVNIILIVLIRNKLFNAVREKFQKFSIEFIIKNSVAGITIITLLLFSVVSVNRSYNILMESLRNELKHSIIQVKNKIYLDEISMDNSSLNTSSQQENLKHDIIVVNSKNEVLWSSKRKITGQVFNEGMIDYFYLNEKGKTRMQKAANKPIMEKGSFMYKSNNYTIYSLSSKNILFTKLNNEKLIYFYTILGLFIIIIIISTYVSKRLSKPLELISRSVGDFNKHKNKENIKVKYNTSIKEVSELIDSFNTSVDRLVEANDALKESNNQLINISFTDEITNLANYRYLNEYWMQKRKELTKLCLLFIDIDNFKLINENFGQAVGDGILKKVSRLINGKIRDSDLLIRYGIDEFIVLLDGLEIEEGATIGEEIRKSIGRIKWDNVRQGLIVTVSMGITYSDNIEEHLEEIVGRAEECLITSKETGKNKITAG